MKYRHALCLYPHPEDRGLIGGLFPPTGLEYIAAALKDHVARVSLIDVRHERGFQSPRKIGEFVRRQGVDLICLSLTWRFRYDKVCRYIRQLPSEITTIVGGHQATECVEEIFQWCPNVTGIIRGEGEQAIQELADDGAWERILGLSYRANGRIVHNANRPLQPIESILPPDRSLRRSRYVPTVWGLPLLNAETDSVLSSRGCPYHCKFCTFDMNPLGQKRQYVSRRPESVVDEIQSSPARVILFTDDNFFFEPDRVERICDLLVERGIDKRYVANARIEASKYPRMLEKAHRAGFRMLLLGIESASDRILKQLGKGFTTAQVREAFTVLRRFPFFYNGYFIYANVGETEEEMLAIPEYARELGLHAITLSRLRIGPFTPLRTLVEKTPGYRIGSNGYVHSDQLDREKMHWIRSQINRRFFFRSGQWRKLLSRLNEGEILTYRQIARMSLMTPLLLSDLLLRRGHRTWKQWREALREKREAR